MVWPELLRPRGPLKRRLFGTLGITVIGSFNNPVPPWLCHVSYFPATNGTFHVRPRSFTPLFAATFLRDIEMKAVHLRPRYICRSLGWPCATLLLLHNTPDHRVVSAVLQQTKYDQTDALVTICIAERICAKVTLILVG